MTNAIKAVVVKSPGGSRVELTKNGWGYAQLADGSWGEGASVTALELEAIIKDLCKARDDCRRANAPNTKTMGTFR